MGCARVLYRRRRFMTTSALRIASLVPSLTELVVALGLGPRLVARTGFCIHPAQALARVPKVGGTKDVNLEKLRRLAPSHVLVNIDENRLETARALEAFVPHVIVTHPCAPLDNLALIDRLAEAFGDEPGVAQRAAELKREVAQELALCAAGQWELRRVLYLIWRQPWMTVARDTYISGMLASVGWQSLPALAGGAAGAARYPVVDEAAPWLRSVELVLMSSEPCRFSASDFDAAQALCPAARVWPVDGETIGWYGPRVVAGLRYLRDLASKLPR